MTRHNRPFPPLAALPLLLLLGLLLLSPIPTTHARRAMGGGLGDDEEDDHGSAAGASTQVRMRSSLCRVHWTIDPLSTRDLRSAVRCGRLSRDVADHVSSILGRGKCPLHVRLRDRPLATTTKRTATASAAAANSASSAGESSSPRPPPGMMAASGGGGAMLRAVGSIGRIASQGRRVRTSWKSGPPSRPTRRGGGGDGDDDLLSRNVRYEEAMLRNYNRVEIEVTLPRIKAKTKTKTTEGGENAKPHTPFPVVVYTFPVGEGEVNPQGYVVAGRGMVKIYPNGRGKRSDSDGARGDDGGVDVGTIVMKASAPPGLVDPTWAKGKKFFWKGRHAGKM